MAYLYFELEIGVLAHGLRLVVVVELTLDDDEQVRRVGDHALQLEPRCVQLGLERRILLLLVLLVLVVGR